jgi:predicted RNA-binding protein with PUA-like domain
MLLYEYVVVFSCLDGTKGQNSKPNGWDVYRNYSARNFIINELNFKIISIWYCR